VNLTAVGCSFRRTPVELRERLALADAQLGSVLTELTARYGCEAVVLSTCNRVELYLARPPEVPPLDADLVAEFLGECHRLPTAALRPHLFEFRDAEAARHLFRVAASLDSLLVGEGQIAGQVRRAFELAQKHGATGAFLNTLFRHAQESAKRVRTQTGISRGHVSVSSVAVDYVRQVFDHFGDKTVLVIGAGKMAGLTLRHLRQLEPQRILVTNRTPEKAKAVADGCGGVAVPWENLDDVLATADIVLSTTGAAQPIVTRERYARIRARRSGGTQVIFDIAVPRDFDPRIHDGDRTCLLNVDDLKRTIDETLGQRRKYLPQAERIVEEECARFQAEWSRRRHGPVIAQLEQACTAMRQEVVRKVLDRLDGKLTPDEKAAIEYHFQLFQRQLLHGPISALGEAARSGGGGTLLEALRKLFRLRE
jgi:glutamyl-tRNA reductase